MPLRSPKRNFFIFGFQRLVWWPKWTPASSNSLIDTTPIPSPPLKACRAPDRTGEGYAPYSQAKRRTQTSMCILINNPSDRLIADEGCDTTAQKPWNVSTKSVGLQGSIG